MLMLCFLCQNPRAFERSILIFVEKVGRAKTTYLICIAAAVTNKQSLLTSILKQDGVTDC